MREKRVRASAMGGGGGGEDASGWLPSELWAAVLRVGAHEALVVVAAAASESGAAPPLPPRADGFAAAALARAACVCREARDGVRSLLVRSLLNDSTPDTLALLRRERAAHRGRGRVKAGETFSLFIDAAGRILRNRSPPFEPALLDGVTIVSFTPEPLAAPAVELDASSSHALAVTEAGGVLSFVPLWQGDEEENLVPSTDVLPMLGRTVGFDSVSVPSPVPFFATKRVVSVAAGIGFSLALVSDGTVYAWGKGSRAMGLGDCDWVHQPRRVEALEGHFVTQVAAGSSNSAFVTDVGEVYASGVSHNGLLGLGSMCNTDGMPMRVRFDEPELSLHVSLGIRVVEPGASSNAPEGRVHVGLGVQQALEGQSTCTTHTTALLRDDCIRSVSLGGWNSVYVTQHGKVWISGCGWPPMTENVSKPVRHPLVPGLEVAAASAGFCSATMLTADGDVYTLCHDTELSFAASFPVNGSRPSRVYTAPRSEPHLRAVAVTVAGQAVEYDEFAESCMLTVADGTVRTVGNMEGTYRSTLGSTADVPGFTEIPHLRVHPPP